MNGILGMLNMVTVTKLDPEQRDQLETAQRCAYSLLAVLNDVLDISKIEAGRMAIETVPFDFCDVVEDCVKTHAAIAGIKGVQVSAEIAEDLPRHLMGDPLRLRQILTNLLSNAVKFTERGFVRLQARRVPEAAQEVVIELSISDTGIGIPGDKLDLIFEKFSQADTSISRRFGGTGLGLAITRSLVQMQNGTISVQSTPDAGSTFAVTLPYTAADEYSHGFESGFAMGSIAGRVLIVEDNQVNQKLVSALLSKHGYTVAIAANGVEALRSLEDEDFRMILMDVQMPVMDGLEATRLIRGNPRWQATPIIAMTARAMEGDKESCLSAGMNGYISKPIHAAHLLSVVEEFAQAQDRAAYSSQALA
jgi:CheY-like chemotaxis protein